MTVKKAKVIKKTQLDVPGPSEIAKINREIEKDKKWILNPNKVELKEKKHILDWAREMMQKHERFFKSGLPNNYTIATGGIDHEAIDVAEIYRKFPNAQLNWRIFTDKNKAKLMGVLELFAITLKADRKVLCRVDCVKV